MGFREVPVFEVREVLRLWLRGEGFRGVERLCGVDRKTVRRYIGAAVEAGLDRGAGEDQLSDAFMGTVVEAVRPHRHDGHGATWRALGAEADQIRAWVEDQGLTVAKVHELLGRRGIQVPVRTLTRFTTELCGPRRGRGVTVRVADGEPGDELQVDFGRMGMLYDSETDRRRVAHALIFTACLSRYSFVWLSFSQTIEAIIDGFEEAWGFFGGVFRTVIPDNMAGIVDKANPTEPRINQAFAEYAQTRGFVIDAARVRHPQDKGLASHCTSWAGSDRYSTPAGSALLAVLTTERTAGLLPGRLVRHREVVLAFVVELFADQAALPSPGLDGARMRARPGGELVQTHQTFGQQSIPTRRQAVLPADVVHHHGVERLAGARHVALLIESPRHLALGAFVQQPVHSRYHFRRGASQLHRGGAQPHRAGSSPVRTTDIAEELGCSRVTVGKRRVRFSERGLDGLQDEWSSGPSASTDLERPPPWARPRSARW
jgi:transposase